MFRFPKIENSVGIVIDMQEKLLGAMNDADAVLARSVLLVNGLNALGVPLSVTEQYPRGLGATVPELAALLPAGTPVAAKGAFSCFGEPAFVETLDLERRPTLILAGIESHVCVLQTALEALNRGFQVLLASDAVSSRRAAEVTGALAQLRSAGCGIFSVEALLFMLLGSAGHPAFKTISKLVR